MTFTPWKLLIVAIAGWMNRQQQDVIQYLRTENQVLREKLGGKRLILNESQKCRLATAAVKLGRDLLRQFGTLFSPDTLLRWHKWMIARKYDGSGKRGPAPKKANPIRKLVLEMAAANPSWGYGHIHGELKKLKYDVSWQTVRRVMLAHGLLPDPDKPYKSTWNTFIKSHWESICACDFFSVEAWGLKGLTRYLVFFVIELATRKVEIVGIHADPCEKEMVQYVHREYLTGTAITIIVVLLNAIRSMYLAQHITVCDAPRNDAVLSAGKLVGAFAFAYPRGMGAPPNGPRVNTLLQDLRSPAGAALARNYAL
jgi:hypothetical protein